MPYIEVTSILFDPEIAGEHFQVFRRKENVNPFGEGVLTIETYSIIGQVGPASRNNLDREQSFSAQDKTIRVITTFKLTGASKDIDQQDFQPDLIFWKNGYYIVDKVEDFSQYGAGIVSADCTAIDYTVPITGGPTGTNYGLRFNANYNSENIAIL